MKKLTVDKIFDLVMFFIIRWMEDLSRLLTKCGKSHDYPQLADSDSRIFSIMNDISKSI